MLRYKQIRAHFFIDTFQVTTKAISQQKNRYIKLFVSDTGFMFVYPMKTKTEIVNAVKAVEILSRTDRLKPLSLHKEYSNSKTS